MVQVETGLFHCSCMHVFNLYVVCNKMQRVECYEVASITQGGCMTAASLDQVQVASCSHEKEEAAAAAGLRVQEVYNHWSVALKATILGFSCIDLLNIMILWRRAHTAKKRRQRTRQQQETEGAMHSLQHTTSLHERGQGWVRLPGIWHCILYSQQRVV